MTEKKRMFSRTRPYFAKGFSCSDCLRLGVGLSTSAKTCAGGGPGSVRGRGERPCDLLVAGIAVLAEQTIGSVEMPLLEMVGEFNERFAAHASRELGVRPDSAGWIDCEKVTGIDWHDPDHGTPPRNCAFLADKAAQDLEMIVSRHIGSSLKR